MQKTFSQLNQILIDFADMWRESPFSTSEPRWLDQYPSLKDWLLTLSDDEVDRLQGDDNLLCQQIAPYLPVAQQIYALIQFPFNEHQPSVVRSYAWQRDVPGRKAEQIEAFAASTGDVTHPLIEWCSGKLHLGRYLAEQFNVPVVGLEINQRLVQQANQLAQRMASEARVEQCDVLSEDVVKKLNHQQHAIALHACGGLHVSLLQGCIEQRVSRISLAPCCYHRFIPSGAYQPLSTIAKNSQLTLNGDDLRTAVRQSNTAADREREKRKKLQRWRLGFDALQRDIRGIDEYLPVPSLSVKCLDRTFDEFCHHVAQLKDIALSGTIDFEGYEAKGNARFYEYSRYELARMAFRRALECWLVLDRVLYLEEYGYQCQLMQFCSVDLTPRNFLIDATYTA